MENTLLEEEEYVSILTSDELYNDESSEGSIPPPPSSVPGETSLLSIPPPPSSLPVPEVERQTSTPSESSSKKVSSLDFERVVNQYSIEAYRDRFFSDDQEQEGGQEQQDGGKDHNNYGSLRNETKQFISRKLPKKRNLRYMGETRTRWALTVLAGLLTGLTTIFIVDITGKIIRWRTKSLDELIIQSDVNSFSIFLRFTIINLALALVSCLLTVAWVPSAAGSGIPEVKAYLNGVRVKRFSSLPLFLVKIVGTILSVSSSLAIGMEGPLVHIGAIVGASCSNLSSILSRFLTRPNNRLMQTAFFTRLWLWTTSDLAHFANDAERRDLITIGAAVGFAASFGAPIGGLLFILDDISTYFSKAMFLRVLVANALGTFCLAWRKGSLSDFSIISLQTFSRAEGNIFLNRFSEIPFYLVVAAVGGAMGGLCCSVFESLNRQASARFSTRAWQLVGVTMLSLVTSVTLFYIPTVSWACKGIDAEPGLEPEQYHSRRFFCEVGEINEMATIVFGSRDEAIKRILTDPSQFQPQTLLVVGVVFFVLMTFTIVCKIPSGVFTPTVLSGASLGGAAGLVFKHWMDPNITPSTYALLGIAAMLAGVQRSAVSICVILVEGTGEIKVLIPVIITVVVARYVSGLIHEKGIFETVMQLKQYSYLEHEIKKKYDIIQVQEIMNEPPVTVAACVKARQLVVLLRTSGHHGFPVVDPITQKFLGLVRRKQIVALLECGIFEVDDKDSTTPSSVISSPNMTPKLRLSDSPMMHWAFHIKDDRYDYLQDQARGSLEDDEYDDNAWLVSVQNTVEIMPVMNMTIEETKVALPLGGDDTLPPLNSTPFQTLRKNLIKKTSKVGGLLSSVSPLRSGRKAFQQGRVANDAVSPLSAFSPLTPTSKKIARKKTMQATIHEESLPPTNCPPTNCLPTGFASVGQDKAGNVIITWLNPEYRNYNVNLRAVMNCGTYCVNEFCPVSKAHDLFTSLGLRWIVVLGGYSGGEVVGMLTRANFLQWHIRERTGLDI